MVLGKSKVLADGVRARLDNQTGPLFLVWPVGVRPGLRTGPGQQKLNLQYTFLIPNKFLLSKQHNRLISTTRPKLISQDHFTKHYLLGPSIDFKFYLSNITTKKQS